MEKGLFLILDVDCTSDLTNITRAYKIDPKTRYNKQDKPYATYVSGIRSRYKIARANINESETKEHTHTTQEAPTFWTLRAHFQNSTRQSSGTPPPFVRQAFLALRPYVFLVARETRLSRHTARRSSMVANRTGFPRFDRARVAIDGAACTAGEAGKVASRLSQLSRVSLSSSCGCCEASSAHPPASSMAVICKPEACLGKERTRTGPVCDTVIGRQKDEVAARGYVENVVLCFAAPAPVEYSAIVRRSGQF